VSVAQGKIMPLGSLNAVVQEVLDGAVGGSQNSRSAKTSMRMNASQKSGIA
jgi:hypothetical protein